MSNSIDRVPELLESYLRVTCAMMLTREVDPQRIRGWLRLQIDSGYGKSVLRKADSSIYSEAAVPVLYRGTATGESALKSMRDAVRLALSPKKRGHR